MMINSTGTITDSTLLTGRGTTALWTALKALDGRGKHVLLPVNICEIVVPAVLNAGYQPIYHDVDPLSGNATLDSIRKAYRPGVVACLAAHNFGTPLDIGLIAEWARGLGVFLIEDVCNALGATWSGQEVGGFGDAAIYSFGHAKILDLGYGGALHVRDSGVREKARGILENLPVYSARHRRADEQFQAVLRSLRQNTMAASPGVYRTLYKAYLRHLLFLPAAGFHDLMAGKLAGLDQNLDSRRRKAALWRHCLDNSQLKHRPRVEGDVYWRYTFLAPKNIRDKLLNIMRDQHIPASKWFPPVTILFEGSRSRGRFPGAEQFADQCLNVFVDQNIKESEIRAAAGIIQGAMEQS